MWFDNYVYSLQNHRLPCHMLNNLRSCVFQCRHVPRETSSWNPERFLLPRNQIVTVFWIIFVKTLYPQKKHSYFIVSHVSCVPILCFMHGEVVFGEPHFNTPSSYLRLSIQRSCLFCNIRRGGHSSFLKAGSACTFLDTFNAFIFNFCYELYEDSLWNFTSMSKQMCKRRTKEKLKFYDCPSCRKLCDAPRPEYVAQPQRLRFLRIRQQRASSDLLLLHDGGQRAGAKLPSTGEFIHSEFDLSISSVSIPLHKTQY